MKGYHRVYRWCVVAIDPIHHARPLHNIVDCYTTPWDYYTTQWTVCNSVGPFTTTMLARVCLCEIVYEVVDVFDANTQPHEVLRQRSHLRVDRRMRHRARHLRMRGTSASPTAWGIDPPTAWGIDPPALGQSEIGEKLFSNGTVAHI